MTTEPEKIALSDVSPRVLWRMWQSAILGLTVLFMSFPVAYYIVGDPYHHGIELLVSHFIMGRSASVMAGLQLGFPAWFLFVQNNLQDIIIMLFVYPLFLTGYQHLSGWPFVGRFLISTHALALRFKDRMATFGALGLMVFVFFPFWSTGPLVGVLVGYLIGLRTWLNFTVVIFGNAIAVAAWILAYQKLKSVSPELAIYVLAVVLVFGVVGLVVGAFRKRQREREEAEVQADIARMAREAVEAVEAGTDAARDDAGSGPSTAEDGERKSTE